MKKGAVVHGCTLCDGTFTSREGRTIHMVIKHGLGKRHECHLCPMFFARPGALRQHLTVHGERPHVCSICGKVFARKETLLKHETMHREPTVTGLSCSVCGLRFRKSGTLERHTEEMHGRHEYNCQYCNKGFKLRTSLKKHLKIHEGEYRCRHCTVAFKTERAHRNHLRIKHWDLLGLERLVVQRGRNGTLKKEKQPVRRNKNNPFVGIEHLLNPQEPNVAVSSQVSDNENKSKEGKKNTTLESDPEQVSCLAEDVLTLPEERSMQSAITTSVAHSDIEAESSSSVELSDHESNLLTNTEDSGVQTVKAKSYECASCSRSFTYQFWLIQHQKHVHGEQIEEPRNFGRPAKVNECSHCGRNFTDLRNLVSHLRRVHEMTITAADIENCSSCNRKVLRSEGGLQSHVCTRGLFTRGLPPHQCTLCHKSFYSDGGLQNHMASHAGHEKIKCDTCGRGFPSAASLAYHQSQVHVEAKFVCDSCGKAFKTVSQMRVHAQIHDAIKTHQCEYCGKAFAQRNGLNAHRKVCHAEQLGGKAVAEREIECNVCQKKLRGKTGYRVHKMKHDNQRPFACEYCEKRFTTKNDRERHRQRHTKDYRFRCRYCPKGSSRRGLVELHELQAHGKLQRSAAKIYTCSHCGRSFPSPSACKTHESLHSDEKNVACTKCDNRFKNVKYLKYHLKARHGDGASQPIVALKPEHKYCDEK